MDARVEVAAGEHADPGEYFGLHELDERSHAGAVREVDGVAAVGEVEVVAGGLVAGQVAPTMVQV